MLHSTSRRAFLSGRRRPMSDWERFQSELAKRVEGELDAVSKESETQQLRLHPKHAKDVHYARELCARYQVLLCVEGLDAVYIEEGLPTLWVSPARYMCTVQPLETGSTQWFMQPGCTMQALVEAGLTQFQRFPPALTVAGLLLDRRRQAWRAGETIGSGVVHASLLMDDGTVSSLGWFGAQHSKPLNTARLRQLVPQLFQLQNGDHAQRYAADTPWFGRYRLDALQPQTAHAINLAQLILGSGGDLGWLDWVVFDTNLVACHNPNEFMSLVAQPLLPALHEDAVEVAEIDAQLKQLFDPSGVFPHSAQVLL